MNKKEFEFSRPFIKDNDLKEIKHNNGYEYEGQKFHSTRSVMNFINTPSQGSQLLGSVSTNIEGVLLGPTKYQTNLSNPCVPTNFPV